MKGVYVHVCVYECVCVCTGVCLCVPVYESFKGLETKVSQLISAHDTNSYEGKCLWRHRVDTSRIDTMLVTHN